MKKRQWSNPVRLAIVEEFNLHYQSNIIIHVGFFIRDLHRQLQQWDDDQFSNHHDASSTLYRGQALSM